MGWGTVPCNACQDFLLWSRNTTVTSKPMDSLPHELHLAILTSLSVRDIHRLGRTNKEWNKNSKDLPILTTLDFSYSPEIKDEDLKRFLSTRFKESKATRVILAHNRFLTNLAIEILFSALPTIQHFESRYCNTLWQTQAFEIVFSQKYLETLKIRYLRSNDYFSVMEDPTWFEISCNNLKWIDIVMDSSPYKMPEYLIFTDAQLEYLIQRYPELLNRHISSIAYHFYFWAQLNECDDTMPGEERRIWGHLTTYPLHKEGVKKMPSKTIAMLKSLPIIKLETNYWVSQTIQWMQELHQKGRIQLAEDELNFLQENCYPRERKQLCMRKFLHKLERRPYNAKALDSALQLLNTRANYAPLTNDPRDLQDLHRYLEYFYKTERDMPHTGYYWLAISYMRNDDYENAFECVVKQSKNDSSKDMVALAKHLVYDYFDGDEKKIHQFDECSERFSECWRAQTDFAAKYSCLTCDEFTGTCLNCGTKYNYGSISCGYCNNTKSICWNCVTTCHNGHNVIFTEFCNSTCTCNPRHGDCRGVDKLNEKDYLSPDIRNIIAKHLSVNDVRNLNLSCKRAKNTFSIRELLDLSYSPLITHEDFERLLTELMRDQVTIKSVILAHNKFLCHKSVELLFEAFPTVTDIRIRHCPNINPTVLRLLLQQTQLESIRLNMEGISCSEGVHHEFDIRCAKLKNLKIKDTSCVGLNKFQLRELLDKNSVLKDDLNFIRYLARHNDGDESLIDFALEKNEISVYKSLWDYFSIQSSAVTATVSLEKYIRKTIQFFNSFAQDELANDNRVAKICKEILKHSELTVVHENQPYLSTFKGCRVNKWHKIEAKKAKRPFRELLSDPTDDEYQYDLSAEFPSL